MNQKITSFDQAIIVDFRLLSLGDFEEVEFPELSEL